MLGVWKDIYFYQRFRIFRFWFIWFKIGLDIGKKPRMTKKFFWFFGLMSQTPKHLRWFRWFRELKKPSNRLEQTYQSTSELIVAPDEHFWRWYVQKNQRVKKSFFKKIEKMPKIVDYCHFSTCLTDSSICYPKMFGVWKDIYFYQRFRIFRFWFIWFKIGLDIWKMKLDKNCFFGFLV